MNFVTWRFCYVSDGLKVDVKVSKIMCCVGCYYVHVNILILNKQTWLRKCFVSYSKNDGIIAWKKHFDQNMD